MTAQDYMSTLQWWAREGTDVGAIHEKALELAANQGNAEDANATAWLYIKSAGLTPVGDTDDFERLTLKRAIITARGFVQYRTDDLADAYRIGYMMFADTSGNDMLEMSLAMHDDEPGFEGAWLAGRADNPAYAKHLAAKQVATEQLQERFGVSEPATAKARAFWVKKYHSARAS